MMPHVRYCVAGFVIF